MWRAGSLLYEPLQSILRKEATREDLPLLPVVKESTVTTPVTPQRGKIDLFTSYVPDPRVQGREAEWLGFLSEREFVSQYVFS